MNRDDEIFADAIELPHAERAAFLDRVCRDDSSRRDRIEALLAGHDAAENFLMDSPIERPAAQAEEKPGDLIGRYTILRKIGDGGCGVVYLAEQKVPVRRRVALKVIKAGMDTREVIARFEAERQALAMMEHPDIARVFDAGATETGRPYFVMEFVDGAPITKFCDEHSLPMAARLELFARVCLAMQHAHQKGIIHRDLKPSNILVALHDGLPTPKVIDFGIAKATQGRLTEQTLFTGVEQFIGTPAYMSPEQAELRDLDIDTRSDVYSLGVVLYEMLTGLPPYDPKSLVQAGVNEIRRIIREVDPPRPSTRLSTLTNADRATVARLRGSGAVQLTSVLRGDLDWIVMRCLEKDRDRRYSTAHQLADDVRRHLNREPVVARPPSTVYRTQKFVSRNRLLCASVAAITASLIIGTVVSVRQAVRATRAEHLAQVERDTAVAAGRAEALARADAQRRQEQAEDLLTFMLGDFRTELQKIGRLNLLDTVGEKAKAYFAALDPRDLSDTALTRQAKALTQIGEVRMDEARYADAATAFNTAYTRAAALAARHPENGDMLFERAQAEYWIGFVANKTGDFVAWRKWFTSYRDSALALVALEGKKPRAQLELTYSHHNLAVVDVDRGNLAEAQIGFLAERATVAEMLVGDPNNLELRSHLADNASWLGSVAERDGRYGEAIDRFAEMSTRCEELVALAPAVPRWQFELAQSATFLGDLQTRLGQTAAAKKAYSRAQALIEKLVSHDKKNRRWLDLMLRVQLLRVELLIAENALTAATEILAASKSQLEGLVAAEPSSPTFNRSLASALRLEAHLQNQNHQPEASAAIDRAIRIGELLVKEARADNRTLWEFTQSCVLAGRISQERGHREVAMSLWNRAVETLTPHIASSNDWRLIDPAAQALTLLGNTEGAKSLIEKIHRLGYHSVDPLAAALFDSSPSPVSTTPPN